MNQALKVDKNSKNVIFKDDKIFCKNWKCFARSKLSHKVMTANYMMHYLLFYFSCYILNSSLLNNKQNRTEFITDKLYSFMWYNIFIQIKFNNKQHFSHLIIICNVGYFLASLNLDWYFVYFLQVLVWVLKYAAPEM